ncbi:putative disease resistance protein RGA3 isoform X2 [Hevea brasiliensis]|uniref:putative disease resistance protein RGA3 isoform X2 n=1 Tax=Hevea brasiliensis TaxID=3981 RepID=UPI0025DEAB03|nr:putative disease resistance protein RGA3 isoform X2 [Hevea brasiliensis]
MADSFLFNVAESVLGKLGSLALQEFSLAWGLESDLEKIKDNLKVIKAVLLDAEQQRSQNPRIEVWLDNLKEVLYDAEDVVDEFECEALRRQVVKSGNTTRKVQRFFSRSNPLIFRFRMGHKLKQIRERVDEVAALKSKFGLTERIFDRHIIHGEREMTHSFIDASDVIGREQARDDIIETLLQSVDGENVSIIPIVGIGGIGKTTLAKLVYNDQRIATHFELKLWVCVSDVFELDKVIIKILDSASPGQRYADMGIDQLQRTLQEALNGNKYLLILDDVWSEDPRQWGELKTLLMGGAYGSKMLVTTRSQRVAEIMGTVSALNLSLLSHQDCLSLFFKWAFKGQQEKQNPNLKRIGEEIVRKCKGVPLAVITLGSLLYSVTDEREWEFIRDNEIWKLEQKKDDILPALRLSYEHLPSHLKRCFAYCSIFPKDYVMDDIELVYLWMANGLVQSSNENQELEDIGLRYFKELCSRCFFQDFSEYGGKVKCKMHDLIHDLALSVTQNECSMVRTSTQQIPKSVRHISFPHPELLPNVLPESLQNLDRVRTICCESERGEGISSEAFIKTCFSRFQYLRFLNLSYSMFEVLPTSIGNLKHLKYLDLWRSPNIQRLPNSICKLQSLQVLLLFGCWSLEELPKDMKYMINLRWLWITTKQKNLPTGGIGCLKSLRFLFITSCDNLEYLFEDMQGLKKLRRLKIDYCRSLTSLPQSIKCLTALETLCIKGCENLDLIMEEGEENQYPTQFSLQKLELEFLPKLVEFPQWLIRGSTNSLKVIKVERCNNLRELPECLQNMASLQEVQIKGCPQLNNDPIRKADVAGPSTSMS